MLKKLALLASSRILRHATNEVSESLMRFVTKNVTQSFATCNTVFENSVRQYFETCNKVCNEVLQNRVRQYLESCNEVCNSVLLLNFYCSPAMLLIKHNNYI